MLYWLAAAICLTMGLVQLVWALRGEPAHGRRRCPRCWYDMRGVPGLTCPECGYDALRRGERALFRTRRRWPAVIAGVLLLFVAATLVMAESVVRSGWRGVPRVVVILAMPWVDLSHPGRPPPADYERTYYWALRDVVNHPRSNWETALLASRLERVVQRSNDQRQRIEAASFIGWAAQSGHAMDRCIPTLFSAVQDEGSAWHTAAMSLQTLTAQHVQYTPGWSRLALDHEDPAVRNFATTTLGSYAHRFGDDTAIKALVEATKDPIAGVASTAALTLPPLAASRATQSIAKMLDDHDPLRVWSAAHALSKYGPAAAEAVPALEAKLADPLLQEEEQIEILRALRSIRGEKPADR